MERLSLLDDIIFRIVFGSKSSPPILRALLNALLGLMGPDRIASLEILSPSPDKEHILAKGVILDIRARDSRGRQYNIEVQLAAQAAYAERTVYYVTRMFTDQLKAGDPYTNLCKTIGISLCDFILFPEFEDLHSIYRLHDVEHDRLLTDILELHYIEVPKFRRDRPHELRTPFEKWLHVLKFGDVYEDRPDLLPEALKEEEGIEMALEAVRQAWATDETRELIESWRRAQHEIATRMEAARTEGREEAREEAREGLRATLRAIVQARFGDLPPELDPALARISSTEALQRLTTPFVQAATLEDLVEASRRAAEAAEDKN